ncbi:TetR/AcrR family transcriptional regulator [Rhizobium sp. NPDC090279]|uniref:TetR/AcrR family transcriptional regulator n=1 Tax=Rhizobium sp. NPDC090279 TaxID=3364499 RepID=UPI00383BF4EF
MTATDRQRPRTKPPEVRREELMDAAQRLFLEKGFGATSVAEIVDAADVAKGTFYLYFQTKDDVLAALKVRFVERFCETIEIATTAAASRDWMERLDVWMQACVVAYLDDVTLHDLVFQQFHPAKRSMKRANPIVSRLASFLLEGHAAGAFSFADARLTAVMLFNAMHGAVDECLADGPEVDRQKLISAVTNFCRRAVNS